MWSKQKTKLLFLVQVSSFFISSPLVAGQIRVGPGPTRCSGRVEVYHNGTWGAVCANGWDKNDANVVCRQLGCGTALGATASAIFGEGTGDIWLDGVRCSGTETSLTTCSHGGFGTHNCGCSEDAGVVCSASLPKPSITMHPTCEVTWGHDVRITCTISTELLRGTFILEKASGSFRKAQTSGSFTIPAVNFDHYGSYRCRYEKTISGQTFSSPFSDDVTITVSFPKPSISMNPAGEVSWGQKVEVMCSISAQVLGGKFLLTKTASSFRKDKSSSSNFASFWIRKADFEDEGSYQCQYQISGSSRDFRSPLSNLVRLSITVRLQRPDISLTSPNSGLVWGPTGAVVTRGSSFTFTCSINCTYTVGRFFLIFSGSNVTDTKPAVNNSASFSFPVAEYKLQGNYSCVYELTLSTRRFNSTEAAPITVNVKLCLLLLISWIRSGILLLFLLVLTVVCLVCRRRRHYSLPTPLTPNQMAVRVQNSSIDNDEDEDDDYNFVSFVDMTNRKLEEEEESDDYDNIFSDGDHVYPGPDLSCLMEEIYVTVEDNTDDEEEETSDEEDYVNVSVSCEQTVDSCQQYKNIYENF